MQKGWHLVSLYTERYPTIPSKPVFVDFAHYTGKQVSGGGSEYDKVLCGHLSYDELRRALRKHLTLEQGNKQRRQFIDKSGSKH